MINVEKLVSYMKSKGFSVTDNDLIFAGVIKGLNQKKEDYGVAYCPCVTEKKHDKDHVCPCLPCRNKEGEERMCLCMLFKW